MLQLTLRERGLALVGGATLMLAGAVGLNAGVLDVASRLVLSPPAGVTRPYELAFIPDVSNYPSFVAIRDTIKDLPITVYMETSALPVRWTGQAVALQCVGPDYFEILGVHLAGGRRPQTGMPEAVVSDGFWRRHWSTTESPLGQTISFRTGDITIVGVVSDGFQGLGRSAVDLWMPLDASPADCSSVGSDLRSSEAAAWLTAVVRLRSESDAARILQATEYLQRQSTAGRRQALRPVMDVWAAEGRPIARLLSWLGVAGVTLLLIAMVNCAALFKLHEATRHREVAIKVALGCSRVRLVGEAALQAVWFGLAGILAAGLAYSWASKILWNTLGAGEPPQSRVVLTMAIAGAVLSLFVLLIRSASVLLTPSASVLRLDRTASPSPRSHYALAAQVAASIVLVVATALFYQSGARLADSLGYAINDVVAVTFDPYRARYRFDDEVEPERERVRLLLQRMPTVQSVAVTSHAPLEFDVPRSFVLVAGTAALPRSTSINIVSPQYFDVTRTVLRSGRAFTASDDVRAQTVAVVDEQLAAALWPEGPALGRCLQLVGGHSQRECVTVVGISARRKSHMVRSSRDEMFVPAAQGSRYRMPFPGRSLVVRTTRPDAVIATMRQAQHELGISMLVRTLGDLFLEQTRAVATARLAFGICAALAIVMLVAGIATSVALLLRSREPEIAIRVALGASPRRATLEVCKRVAVILGIGIVVGLVAAGWASRYLQSGLYEVGAWDTSRLIGAGAVITSAIVLAASGPLFLARRLDIAARLKGAR